MTESQYQLKLIKRIKALFPGCLMLKNDSGYQQGIPDWTVLFGKRWAVLEIKNGPKSIKQANQEYFVEKLGSMSYAAIIHPDNEEEVLIALQRALDPRRRSRISKS